MKEASVDQKPLSVESTLVTNSSSVRAGLAKDGFAQVAGHELALPAHLEEEEATLVRSFENLPDDQYGETKNRQRRFSAFTMLPWTDILEPLPAASYHQSSTYNQEAGGVSRAFERIEAEVEQSSLLRGLIRYDLEQTLFSERDLQRPIRVHVHQIRMFARPGCPGKVVPNELHKDGEPYTWVHLIGLHNIGRGGDSLVTDNDKKPLARFTLKDRWDSFVIDDAAVYHYVSPVHVRHGSSRGYRDTLLIDFTPLRPDIPSVDVN